MADKMAMLVMVIMVSALALKGLARLTGLASTSIRKPRRLIPATSVADEPARWSQSDDDDLQQGMDDTEAELPMVKIMLWSASASVGRLDCYPETTSPDTLFAQHAANQ